MSQFDDREKAAENKFSHDKELEFKATARRNKLLGQWAAKLMGMEGEAIDAYAKQVVESDFEEAGEEDVYRKIAGDFETAEVEQSEHQIRREMEDLMSKAIEQIKSEV
ncbi:DUF1476 domain-containing protein [Pseudemcibacter aquimaris]|uniref:DUF1476 domain-containing protein n=1 Tax=Pseudemcibacter aquimaris TaxID=2857064 RepID=UPI002011821D|nr:DUF1476 domain-containing protein [Pseudemcibacter aquimaris]MCC3859672.1 DUF1476 domain-containing protein [Pseudemcibacter aquimaris]WDU60067.1 DUF1476 domain-containing protein [Pseudemcibacter aquimaris]